ncbi:MAG: hypothetical protein U0929_07070 [Planctomycetaceae bacterium]
MMLHRNFILFRSELFQHEQADDQIGHWFVGGDCAGWFYARLLPLPNIAPETAPVMEDWGWFASVKTRDTDTSVALLVYPWDYLDHCWMIGLDPKRRFLRKQSDNIIRAAVDSVADQIDGVISSDDRFESFGWYEKNPFETGVTDPRG